MEDGKDGKLGPTGQTIAPYDASNPERNRKAGPQAKAHPSTLPFFQSTGARDGYFPRFALSVFSMNFLSSPSSPYTIS